MIKETTLYTAICDRCGTDFADSYYRTIESEKRLEAILILYQWHDTRQLHFCPDCYTIDENNELKLKLPITHETND